MKPLSISDQFQEGKSIYEIFEHEKVITHGELPPGFAPCPDEQLESEDSTSSVPIRNSYMRCIFQTTRPRHISGLPDSLPFESIVAARAVFWSLELPAAYLEIADGSPATVHSHIIYDKADNASSFEFIAQCVTKQGDWAIALAHKVSTCSTSVFWSIDERIDSTTLKEELNAFHEYALHPMLIPCIMLSATLRMALQRRYSIKDRLDRIEKAVARISEDVTASSKSDRCQHEYDEDGYDLENLFGLLHGCRNDQVSRKGRYDFWNSFSEAIEEGFEYARNALPINANDHHHKAHSDLRKWKSLTWQRLKSLMGE